jgi:hypothetical protein
MSAEKLRVRGVTILLALCNWRRLFTAREDATTSTGVFSSAGPSHVSHQADQESLCTERTWMLNYLHLIMPLDLILGRQGQSSPHTINTRKLK